jgi:hypothetical protein
MTILYHLITDVHTAMDENAFIGDTELYQMLRSRHPEYRPSAILATIKQARVWRKLF